MRTLVVVATAILSLALPGVADSCANSAPCMAAEDAQQVADNFGNLYLQYTNLLGNVSMASNLTYYSDSIAILINSGCRSPTQVSRKPNVRSGSPMRQFLTKPLSSASPSTDL
jgi:hypothetical protein